MMYRAFRTASVCLFSLALFVACGGDKANGVIDPDDVPDTAPTPDVDQPDGVSFDLSGPPTDSAAANDSLTEQDGLVAPGGFMAPCLENNDCNSGYCVETPNGSVCTRNCETDCPEDWRCSGIQSSTSDVTFICMPLQSRLCLPCTADLQCAAGYCLPDSAGNNSCTRPCGDEDSCPDGFICEERTSLEAETRISKQCVPATGRCDCTARNAGEERPCPIQNEFGRCWGTQVCDGAAGWSLCDTVAPASELCDGLDQNCNGVVDEFVEPPAEDCQVGNDFGSCVGAWSCAGESGWRCDAREPRADTCNYQDDNCDGTIDEDFRDVATGLYVNDQHCGLCNNSCAGRIPFATATRCAIEDGSPVCIATACQEGYFIPEQTRQACVPLGGGFQCSPCFGDLNCGDLADGRCEVLDGSFHCTRGCETQADCDGGYVCDAGRCKPQSGSCSCLSSNDGNVRTCRNTNDSGTCFGTQRCDAASGWTGCTASNPAPEVCNGTDDNCNGFVDEDVAHVPATCGSTNDFGSCASPWICRGVSGWSCLERTPEAETCNYEDDNCDGRIDEGFLDDASGQYLTLDNCGACGISCVGALPNATSRCGLGPTGRPRCEVDTCDSGYIQQGPLACVPASADNCIPCASAAACAGGSCAALDGGNFCLNRCERDDNCLPGYSCIDHDGARLCVPDTRSCRCDGSDTSLLRGCSVDYTGAEQEYSCFGTQRCTTAGWESCTLGGEECNLLDDDCDGEVDEDFLVDGEFATDDNCGQCGNDCTLLDFPGGGGICNRSVSPPRCSLRCTGNCFDLNANPLDGCECCNPTPTDYPDVLGIDSNCDGIDGERENGVFVAKWGNDLNSGRWGEPKLTIQAAVTAAVALGRRDVYVATGIYRESIVLERNIGVYGGYASDFARRDFGLFETAVLGLEVQQGRPAAINAIGIVNGGVGGTVFDGFSIYGVDVRTPGGSSFAVWVADSDNSLRITNNQIFAGSGGKGRRGADGTDGANAPNGTNGLAAIDVVEHFNLINTNDLTCRNNLHTRSGGAAGVHTCAGTATSGGSGGNRLCPAWNNTTNETSLPPASSRGVVGLNGAATGGQAGRDVFHQRFSCEGYDTFGPVEGLDGQNGAWGADGVIGAGCSDADGMVIAGVWMAGMAASGGGGAHAGGGGGGGSGAGAFVHSSCFAKGLNYDNLGGTGGGGGAGGCAGTHGGAGTSGGGVFGIFIAYATVSASLPELAFNVIHGGDGGDGGDGGNGGVGGSGGNGGFGGPAGGEYKPSVIIEPSYPAFKGGKGGNGGNGGHGGGGGGGCGGPAFGIYAAGVIGFDLAAWAMDNAFPSSGRGGSGGLGGFSLGNAGGSGADGQSGATNF